MRRAVRYWLVGDSAGRDHAGDASDFWTPDETGLPSPANRLLELTGWSIATFLATFCPRVNLWSNPNRIWVDEGRAAAARVSSQSLADGSIGVVILGARAAAMFGFNANEELEWRGRFAFVPHPSGQSRYWTTEHRQQGRAFFASLLSPQLPSRAARE